MDGSTRTTQGSKVSVGSVDMEQRDEPVKTRRKKTYLLKKNITKGVANQEQQPAVPSKKVLQYPLKPMEKQIVANIDGEVDNKSGTYFARNSASSIPSKASSNRSSGDEQRLSTRLSPDALAVRV